MTGRDDLGRITAKTETVEGTSQSYAYGYDTAGRLRSVTRNSTLIGYYNYDDNGMRIPNSTTLTFNQTDGVLSATTYDQQDRLLSTTHTSHSTAYEYTPNGELMKKSVTTAGGTDVTEYVYDFLGNLRQVTLHATDTPTVIKYVVDGNNRRVGKKVGTTLEQAFLYDGQLRIVAELDGGGVLVSRFVYASKSNVPDYMVQGSSTYRIISDHLGSVRLVVNAATGLIRQRLDYDEFGNVSEEEYDANGDPVVPDPIIRFQPFGFAGGLRDPQTGLVRFGARDYDPETGRWTAKDPIGLEGGSSNVYGYVSGQPISRIDPDGRAELGLIATVAAVSATAILGNYAYMDLHALRSSLQQQYPGHGRNDSLRHCVASCVAAHRFGEGIARLAGFLNELNGLWIDLRNQQEGAFELQDLWHNEIGFALSIAPDEESCYRSCTDTL